MSDFGLRVNHVKHVLSLCLQKSNLNFDLRGQGTFGAPVFEDAIVAKYKMQ